MQVVKRKGNILATGLNRFTFLVIITLFGYISRVLPFPIDTTDILIQRQHLCVLYFLFHGSHFTTTLWVLKALLCFHIDHTCRYHQSNLMSDSIFSVNIAHCIAISVTHIIITTSVNILYSARIQYFSSIHSWVAAHVDVIFLTFLLFLFSFTVMLYLSFM